VSSRARGPRRRRKTTPHPTATRLVEVAAEVISERGIAGFTGEEVLARVGLTSGVLYYHYGDVEGLRSAALAHLYAARATHDTEAVLALVEQAATVDEFRTALLALLREVSARHRGHYRLLRAATLGLAYENEDLRQRVTAAQDALTELIEQVLDEALGRGWLSNELSVRAMAVLIQAMLLGRVVDDIATEAIDDDSWFAAVAHVVNASFLPAGSYT
jgi:AcrR family transcriptional regulator